MKLASSTNQFTHPILKSLSIRFMGFKDKLIDPCLSEKILPSVVQFSTVEIIDNRISDQTLIPVSNLQPFSNLIF